MVWCVGAAGIGGAGALVADSDRSELDAADAAAILFGGIRSGAAHCILPALGVRLAQCRRIERLVQPWLAQVRWPRSCICSLECHVSCKCGTQFLSASLFFSTNN